MPENVNIVHIKVSEQGAHGGDETPSTHRRRRPGRLHHLRELRETWFQFAQPRTTDSTRSEATLGVKATPHAEGAAATVAWWRARMKA